jgi:hypothetical protein
MTTPSPTDGVSRPDGEAGGDAPFLPPARPVVPAPAHPIEPEHVAAPTATADAPFLPNARPPEPVAPPAAPSALAFDAKAMVESQKHYNVNPAYGPMPTGTEESRAAARKLREDANRKRRRGKVARRVAGVSSWPGSRSVGTSSTRRSRTTTIRSRPRPTPRPTRPRRARTGHSPRSGSRSWRSR